MRCRSSPSGRGVNLLNSGAMIRGASTFITSSKAVMAPNAQIHQNLPVRSMNQNSARRIGIPSTAEIASPFRRSITQIRSVVLLKPKRASMEKVAYREKGSPTSQNRNETAAMKTIPWR